MSRIPRRTLISRISKHTDIRSDVVEEVLEGFLDVAVEEIIEKGEFGFKDLFSISSHAWGEYSIGDKKIESHSRLKIRISTKIRNLWKLKNSSEEYSKNYITKDNWKNVYKYFFTDGNEYKKDQNESKTNSTIERNNVISEPSHDDLFDSIFSDE